VALLCRDSQIFSHESLHVRERCSLHELHYTGWRRLIGCLQLQVILHKRATNYRALLQKMTYKDKTSYESSPPCNMHQSLSWSSLTNLSTEWRNVIGCLTLQVILHKRATNYRALLQKMTYKDETSYDSSPPCNIHQSLSWISPMNLSTEWCRGIGCLIFIGHFKQKSPRISGSFSKNDLRLVASYESSPPCNMHESLS